MRYSGFRFKIGLKRLHMSLIVVPGNWEGCLILSNMESPAIQMVHFGHSIGMSPFWVTRVPNFGVPRYFWMSLSFLLFFTCIWNDVPLLYFSFVPNFIETSAWWIYNSYFTGVIFSINRNVGCMFLSCHVRVSEWIYTLYLPECQGTPCSKQVQYLKFQWLQRDSNPQPLSS